MAKRRSTGDRQAARRAGQDAERFVAALLQREGWSILDRNWRGGGGELDLVAVRSGALRFVEVKLRDAPPESDSVIGWGQRRRLVQAAEAWLATHENAWKEVSFLLARVWPHALDGFAVAWTDDALLD